MGYITENGDLEISLKSPRYAGALVNGAHGISEVYRKGAKAQRSQGFYLMHDIYVMHSYKTSFGLGGKFVLNVYA